MNHIGSETLIPHNDPHMDLDTAERPPPSLAQEMPARILCVDDDPVNRELLQALLDPQGYFVIEAACGQDALNAMTQETPDLILLDVMMPGMDGFELCRQLRNNPETASLPIILITSLHDRENRLKGIEAGADDFLTKPIDKDELLLRVRNSLRARRSYIELQHTNERLHELERLRDGLTHMIIHDMRSPLMVISMGLETIRDQHKSSLDPESHQHFEQVQGQAVRLIEMVSSILEVSKFENGCMNLHLTETNIADLIQSVINSLRSVTGTRHVEYSASNHTGLIQCDQELLTRVLFNLISNAAKFTTRTGSITVATQETGEGIEVSIQDNGHGIPSEYHDRIFEKFGQVRGSQSHRRFSTGMGLTFCKLAVKAHGGTIRVKSMKGEGSTFFFTLPRKAPSGIALQDSTEPHQ